MTALQVSTVLACVNIISNGVAAMPLNVYERVVTAGSSREGKKKARNHNLFDLLHDSPNVEMTSFTWRKTEQIHACLWGNCYSEIERNNNGDIIALWPRNPARTRPVRLTKEAIIEGDKLSVGTLVYETNETKGDSQIIATDDTDENVTPRRIILSENMFHVPGMSLDGRLGQSTVWLTRQTIGLALATEKYAAKFFANNARPSGILEIPATLTPVAMENLKRSWAEAHGGENAWKTAVLEAGVKYQKIGATPNEGQLSETRQHIRQEIATIFNVPGHMIGEQEHASRATVEQAGIEFVTYTLGPWLESWQQEFKRKLMPKLGRTTGKFFVKFDTRRLLYPEADSRSKFYAAGKQWGFLNSNDIRELEDMDPIPGPAGEKYWMPVNMMDAGDINQIVPAGAPPPPGSVADIAAQKKISPVNGQGKSPAGKKKPANKNSLQGNTRSLDGSIDVLGDVPAWIMRHGATAQNDAGNFRGWGEWPLDENGVEQVNNASDYLASLGIRRIVSCDLPRTAQTASIVSTNLDGIPVILDPNLRTWNVGPEFQGKPKKDLQDKLRHYIENPDESTPNGESLNAFKARNAAAVKLHLSENELEGPTLMVTSLSNIAALDGVDAHDDWKESVNPGGVAEFEKDGTVTTVFANEEETDDTEE
jgi:HK97 family phage portal protein